ncbi:peptidase domain-containing protein [Thermomicrobium sp. CFH 73360]|uniref:peptidase domain-containing protein n=1 Tax=Thermomicrobium sp. CFH 73360 TaxID=2951987 RepID=UPI002077751C|nr:peptidase domain-containing protein [Thermomicrobium sp. CFH 73360]MCM8747019.1 peptidase domain-containing protein [Thermomicrobium sp. CFH 73360]
MRGARSALLMFLVLTVMVPFGVSAQEATPAWWSLAGIDRDRALVLVNGDGRVRTALVQGMPVTEVVWSPEGGRLAFTGLQNGVPVVGIATTGASPRAWVIAPGRDPAWSTDGRWLAWLDGDEVVIATREGERVQRVAVGANRLVWSLDGRWLAFTKLTGEPDYSSCPVVEVGWIARATGAVTMLGRGIGDVAWIARRGDAEQPQLVYTGASDARLRWADPTSGTSGVLWDGYAETCRGPLLTSADGQWLAFLDAAGGGDDVVLLNLVTGGTRRLDDLPVGYPSIQLPRVYLWLDPLARFLYASRSFPTVVTRVDLVTGVRTVAAADPGVLVAVGPEGERLAFVRNSPGKLPVLVIIEPATGHVETVEGLGWVAWEPAAYQPVVFSAWQRTWEREDRPVAGGLAARSWTWGPQPLRVTIEEYRDAPGGRRAVLYWDKARMEVTALSGSRETRWYVTNGLLAKELITGQVQIGDAVFEEREPAMIAVAGDLDDPSGPTYATFHDFLTAPPLPVGVEIRWRMHRDGRVTEDGPGGVFAAVLIPETNHTVADVFWAFLQSEGLVWGDDQVTEGRLFEPTFFATGFPITEPYWATVKVGGVFQDVLVQCFERRCLTYTPSNAPGWQVEMGNVGLHYLAWRDHW